MTNSIKTLAGALLLGTALALAPVAAIAQDTATPAATDAAPATDAQAPAADAAPAAPATQPPAAPVQLPPGTVIAQVGDLTVTEADLSFAAEQLRQQLQQVPPEQQEAYLVTLLIDTKLMAKAARDAGLDQGDMFKRRVQYLEDDALRREFVLDKIAGGITEDAIKAAYDKYVADFKPEEQWHARHILVATEDEAKAVKADLDGGKPFEVEAMAKTTDPSGKQNGGDLGFFSKGQMVPEFETAVATMKPGDISAPVKSQFGWHIIKLEETKMSAPDSYDTKKQELAQTLMINAYDASIADLKKTMPITIPDPKLAQQVLQEEQAPAQ